MSHHTLVLWAVYTIYCTHTHNFCYIWALHYRTVFFYEFFTPQLFPFLWALHSPSFFLQTLQSLFLPTHPLSFSPLLSLSLSLSLSPSIALSPPLVFISFRSAFTHSAVLISDLAYNRLKGVNINIPPCPHCYKNIIFSPVYTVAKFQYSALPTLLQNFNSQPCPHC